MALRDSLGLRQRQLFGRCAAGRRWAIHGSQPGDQLADLGVQLANLSLLQHPTWEQSSCSF